jgi:hypothetical protein
MVRGLIAGTVAFGLAFGAERLFTSLGKDFARYDAMREMSGQPPLVRELFSNGWRLMAALIGGSSSYGSAPEKTGNFFEALTHDVVRYAKMKGM